MLNKSANDQPLGGVFIQRGGSVQPLVIDGNTAPTHSGPGAIFSYTSSDGIALSSTNFVAFHSQMRVVPVNVALNNNEGIWSDRNGTLNLVAREGDTAPGTSNNTVFGHFAETFDDPAINSSGAIAFTANLIGPGTNSSNDYGLWAEDAYGNIQLIAREGNLFDIGMGSYRTVESILFSNESGGEDGRGMSFNDSFTLAFSLTFTDGSTGVFTATLIPEPSSIAFLICGAGVLAWKTRRKQ